MEECLIKETPSKMTIISDLSEKSSVSSKISKKRDEVAYYFNTLIDKSNFKNGIAKILGKFQSKQYLVTIFSTIFGVAFFTSFIVVLVSGYLHFGYTIIFISGVLICYSFIIIVIQINLDHQKESIITKWTIKYICKNIGVFSTSSIFLSIGVLVGFFMDILKDNEKIEYNFSGDLLDTNELETDLVLKYIINANMFRKLEVEHIQKFGHLQVNFINLDTHIQEIRDYLYKIFIPLLIISIIKVIKCLLIKVKFFFGQFIFFVGTLLFSFSIILLTKYFYNDLNQWNINLIYLIQIIIIGIIYIGYSIWTINYMIKFIRNPKDKSFAIRKYNKVLKILLIINDVLAIIGASFIFGSIFYFFLSLHFIQDNYNNLYISKIFLYIGFSAFVFSNNYYLGHHYLAMMFRPVATEFAPYEIKNKCYIRANRKLINRLSFTKKKKFEEEKEFN